MVGFRLGLNLFANLLAGGLGLRESEIAILSGDRGQLLNDIEEGVLALVGEMPALRDGAGENLLVSPGVGLGSFISGRRNGYR